MRSLDLDSLRIFRAVVETGGITPAAAQLGRVQSNITTRIRQLEERLGTSLFRRERNRLILSEDGARLLTYAERLLLLADEAELAMKPGGLRGTLRIGALESTTAARLPPLLAAFHGAYPDVHVDLVTGDTATLLQRVARFELEAAFVSEPFDAEGFETQPAFSERLALIAPKSMPPLRGPEDLRGRTMIAFETGCSYRRIFEAWLAEAQVQPARVMELASYHAIFACVVAGAGVGIMPHAVIESLRAEDQVQLSDLPPTFGHVQTHLVWRSSQPSGPLKALQTMLASRSGAT
ncbi:LysR family transcriptional regulator [Cereibacter sphaeroides]|nr:LysR family transcriptional regulator [Cereibacter sphaeroides]